MEKKLSDIGMIGLAVMGENLTLNMENKGFTVSVYNREIPGVEEGVVDRFMNGRGKGKNFMGFTDLEAFVKSIKRPRKIMMMIKAGKPVDEQIEKLLPLLDEGDIIIDGGNSNFEDTIRRTKYLEDKGILFVGTGVSGGEEGALNGPSLMPGGSEKAWRHVKPVFMKIAAKVDDGTPCANWVGSDGAGHFVKMVHNGIEYGDMQIIAESYWLMKNLLKMSNPEIHEVFKKWNEGELSSYLIEITADILIYKDDDGGYLIDKILDAAGQKGTGKWSVISALNVGVPLNLISESVFFRILSSMKEERVEASKILGNGNSVSFDGDKESFVNNIEKALYASKLVSYAQGFSLMRKAAGEYGWNLNYGDIAMLWRGGCIIRSVFLDKIKNAFDKNPELPNLLLDDFFKDKVIGSLTGWKKVVSQAVLNDIPVPAMATALNYFNGYRSEHLPANLIQAQRDYFGAHTYERVDKQRKQYFHTDWTGKGGKTSSTNYQV